MRGDGVGFAFCFFFFERIFSSFINPIDASGTPYLSLTDLLERDVWLN